MELDIRGFCRLLAKAADEPTVPLEGINEYLLDEVFRPTLKGEPPQFRDIDYTKFEEEDIDGIEDYCERAYSHGMKLEQYAKAIGNSRPVPCRIRQFC